MFHAPIGMARLVSLSTSKAEMEMVFLASLLKISRPRFGEDVEVFNIVNESKSDNFTVCSSMI